MEIREGFTEKQLGYNFNRNEKSESLGSRTFLQNVGCRKPFGSFQNEYSFWILLEVYLHGQHSLLGVRLPGLKFAVIIKNPDQIFLDLFIRYQQWVVIWGRHGLCGLYRKKISNVISGGTNWINDCLFFTVFAYDHTIDASAERGKNIRFFKTGLGVGENLKRLETLINENNYATTAIEYLKVLRHILVFDDRKISY